MNVLQGRQVTPQEVKLMIVLASHGGSEPLRLEQIEVRMRPQSLCEEQLLQGGLLERRVDRVGRPIPASLQLSARGRSELPFWLSRAISACDEEAKKALSDEHRTLLAELKTWLSRYSGQFPFGGEAPAIAPARRQPPALVSTSGRQRNIPPTPKATRTTTRVEPDDSQDGAGGDTGDYRDGEEVPAGSKVGAPQEPAKRGPGRPRKVCPVE